jgi:hypothetical protein
MQFCQLAVGAKFDDGQQRGGTPEISRAGVRLLIRPPLGASLTCTCKAWAPAKRRPVGDFPDEHESVHQEVNTGDGERVSSVGLFGDEGQFDPLPFRPLFFADWTFPIRLLKSAIHCPFSGPHLKRKFA